MPSVRAAKDRTGFRRHFSERSGAVHVAWDMTHAGRIQTGTGTYSRNLMAALEDCDVRISTIVAPRLFDGRTGFLARSSRAAHQVMWTQLGLRKELLRINPDLLHAPAFVSSLVAPCPMVVTIHDTAYIHYPQHYEKPWLWYTNLLVPPVARRAAAIIADSEHARQDAQHHLNVPPDKVHAVYPGVDTHRFRPLDPSETAAVALRYRLNEPFVLHVGNLAVRKNIPTLLKAVFRLKRANFWRNRRVVLAGGVSPGLPGHAEVRATTERLGLEREVVLLGHVPDDDLPAIYNLADAVVMPTLHEGFGLPVLEAMACGRPVIASNCSSLPEVAGDAALLVDPRDGEAWAQALSQVLTDEALRQSMIERGLVRARRFSWEKTAEATLRVYRDVLANDSRPADAGAAPREMRKAS